MFKDAQYISKKLLDFADTARLFDDAVEARKLEHLDPKECEFTNLERVRNYKREFLLAYALSSFFKDIMP